MSGYHTKHFSRASPCWYCSLTISTAVPVTPGFVGPNNFFYFFFSSSGGWGKIKLFRSSPHFHVFSYASCVDLTQLLSQPNASWRTLRVPSQVSRKLSLSVVFVTTIYLHFRKPPCRGLTVDKTAVNRQTKRVSAGRWYLPVIACPWLLARWLLFFFCFFSVFPHFRVATPTP